MLITVIGGGSWGSALARILGDNSNDVIIFDNDTELVNEINNFHTNKKKLPVGELPLSVTATSNLKDAIKDSEVIVLAVPTKVTRVVLKQINEVLDHKVYFVNASKGLEPDTFYRISEIVQQEINNDYISAFVALTGPSHAEEVIQQMLTTICSVSEDHKAAKLIQQLFNNRSYFRVYTNYDLVGAEICGALKNVYAIASGILYGLNLGDNARAGLITRALVEMKRILVAYGGNPDTLFGLTGVGDLVVTCTSKHSRNFQAGIKLATGSDLEETINSMSMVVEGARTTISAYQFARKHNIETPILDAVYNVIYNKKEVNTVIDGLMSRTLKHE